MMDSGRILMDIGEAEKKQLTLDALVKKFREIKKQDLSNDQMLLQCDTAR